LTGQTEVPLKKWNHLVLAREDRKVTVYLNGSVEISGEIMPPEASDCDKVFIGGDSGNNANFEGKLDEVAIYKQALKASEVSAHFKASGM